MSLKKVVLCLMSIVALTGAISPAIPVLADAGNSSENSTVDNDTLKSINSEDFKLNNNDLTSIIRDNWKSSLAEAQQNPNNIPAGYTQQEIQSLADQITFLFQKVGTIDNNGNYVLTNPDLLRQRGEAGDENAMRLYLAMVSETRSTKSVLKYAACVFVNATPGISDAAAIYQIFASIASHDIIKVLETGSSYAIAVAIGKLAGKVVTKLISMGANMAAKDFTSVGFAYSLVSAMIGCSK